MGRNAKCLAKPVEKLIRSIFLQNLPVIIDDDYVLSCKQLVSPQQ